MTDTRIFMIQPCFSYTHDRYMYVYDTAIFSYTHDRYMYIYDTAMFSYTHDRYMYVYDTAMKILLRI